MNTVRELAASLCFTLLAAGIFSLLVPGRSMERVLRFTLSLFLLSSLLLPVLEGNSSVPFRESRRHPEVSARKLRHSTEETLRKLIEGKLENRVRMFLERQNITPRKVSVRIHIDDQGNISITECSVILSRENKMRLPERELTEMLRRELGVTPLIITEEGAGTWGNRQEKPPL